MKDELKKIIDISRNIGQCPDLVQGAGGNFSVKIDSRKMLIKASGFRFSEVSENNGLVAIDYGKLLKYYNALDFSSVSKSDSADFINSCILEKIGPEDLRPSIETGFHALLGKYVIHTHSVYANIISCVVNGEKLWNEISEKLGILAVWVDYQSPGPQLALAVKKAIENFKGRRGAAPEAILMQNHGLIVFGENLDRVFNLHNEIQEIIKLHLNLKPFPEDRADYFKNFIKINKDFIINFSKNILFPDQAVFCGNIGEKILINEKTGDIIYKTNKKEAVVIEENLIAWVYIFDCAKNCGLALNFISSRDINYINNMESEKYRKELFKK